MICKKKIEYLLFEDIKIKVFISLYLFVRYEQCVNVSFKQIVSHVLNSMPYLCNFSSRFLFVEYIILYLVRVIIWLIKRLIIKKL